MLYLNNPLLTSEGIVAYFENQVLTRAPFSSSKVPSPLKQLKNKLKAIFFEQLEKNASDQMVLNTLAVDDRFISEYPKLKQVLVTLFSLNDTDDQLLALRQLKLSSHIDWNMVNAQTQYENLNNQYGYFDSTSSEFLSLFKQLAVACRSIIVLFEKNNTPDDTMAYEYAYKLMALYHDPINPNSTKAMDTIAYETYKLLRQVETNKPFHDVLLVKLLLPDARELHDQIGWRRLIKKEGDKLIPLLSLAKKMEDKLASMPGEVGPRAPRDLEEAKKIASLCHYTRASENADFAELCRKYKVPEMRFNQCLDYLARAPGWPKKNADSIPDLIIQGVDEAAGFYWVKLPIADKRSLILGDITNCCQSIGGDSDACVRDAVRLSDNGLYVLLKQKRKTGHPSLVVAGVVNDAHFDIIGQSYVWKSRSGNICLDSIECLKNSITEPALKQITTDFAKQLLQNHSDIKRVTVGRGGNTPAQLFSETTIPEIMRQGKPYGDSSSQYCIAKTSRLDANQVHALNQVLKGQSAEFCECIEYLSEHVTDTTHFVDQLSTLLQETPALSTELTPRSLDKFFGFNRPLSLNDLAPVDFDQLDNMTFEQRALALENISINRLLWRTKSEFDVLRVLQYLPKDQHVAILNEKNIMNGWLSPVLFRIILKIYPENEHLRIIKNVIQEEALLTNTELLPTILDALPPEQRLDILKIPVASRKSVLWLIVNMLLDANYILAILKKLPSEHLLDALRTDQCMFIIQQQEGSTTLIESIVEMLSEQQYRDILNDRDKYGRTLLHLSASNPELLQFMLNRLSPQERVDALNKTEGQGKTVYALCFVQEDVQSMIERYQAGQMLLIDFEHDLNLLKILLLTIPENQRLERIRGEFLLQSAIQNPKMMEVIWTTLSDSQKLEIVKEKNDQGNTVFHTDKMQPSFFKEMLMFIPEEQRFAVTQIKNVYGESVLSCVKNKPELLKIVLETYSKEALLKLSQELDFVSSMAYRSPDSFNVFLSVYPEEHKLALVNQNIMALLFDFRNQADTLAAVVRIYSEEQRLLMVNEKTEDGETLLHMLANNPVGLRILLESLPIEQRIAALSQKTIYGHNVLHLAALFPDSMKTILEVLPSEQHLEALNKKNGYGETVLQLLDPNAMKMIMQAMRQDPPTPTFCTNHVV